MYPASQLDGVYVWCVCRASQLDGVYVWCVCRASRLGVDCVFLCVFVCFGGFLRRGCLESIGVTRCIGSVHDDDDVGVCMMMSGDDVSV